MQLRIVAHRGHAHRFPENSTTGVEDALRCGADDIEIDIQLTRDGVAVLYHDATLDRVSGMAGSLLDLDATTAMQIPAGEPQRFGDQFAGVKIAPLASLCQILASHPSATLFAEIKEESLLHHSPSNLVATVLEDLRPIIERVTVISYDPEILRLARAQGRPIGWVVRKYDDDHRQVLDELQPDIAIVNHTKIDDVLWQGAWSWMAYEVTSAQLARSLAAQGFRYVETMAVAALRAGLDPSP
ncbi:MAG: glycerophosphodiester phosphodiesterase family protein [Planctomycetota bacterium]